MFAKQSLLVAAAAVTALGARPAGAGDSDALMPLRSAGGPRAKPAENRLRGDHTLLMYAPRKGAELRLAVRAAQVGRYDAEVLAHPEHDPNTRLQLRPTVENRRPEGLLRFAAPRAGVVAVRLSTGANAAAAWADGDAPWAVVVASARQPLHVISRVEALYFHVPAGTRRFAAFARGGGGRENARVRIFDATGRCAAAASAEGARTAWARAEVPDGQAGKVWSLRVDRPAEFEGTFEDALVWLSDDVPPYVASRPDGLLVPFVGGLSQPPTCRSDRGVTVTLHANAEPPAGAKLAVAALRPGMPIAPPDAVDARQPLRITVDAPTPPGRYDFRVRLLDGAGRTLASAPLTLTVTPSLVFAGAPRPLVAAEIVPREAAPPALVLRNQLGPAELPLTAEVLLLRSEIPDPPGSPAAAVVLRHAPDKLADGARTVEPPASLRDGHYQWKVLVRLGGEVADVAYGHFLLRGGAVFAEVPPAPGGPLPALRADERKRGFVCFVPGAADAVAYNARPAREQIGPAVRIELARDEYEPGTFGIWAARELRGLTVAAGPLRRDGGDETLPLAVRIARHWPQRMSWNTSTYRIIPEMLEAPKAFDLALDEVRQVWLTAHAAAGAKAGTYRGEVLVRAAGGGQVRVAVEARVLPFRLLRPKHVHWGLYSDSARWRRYPDAQVAAELTDVAAHGITTLMCYPLAHAKVELAGGKLRIDDAEFFRYMKIARQARLGPPWVMSFQPLSSTVRRLTGGEKLTSPAFKKLFQAIAGHFARRGREDELGECVWHTLDEPWRPEQIAQAATELGYLKELGLTTFTTAGRVPPALDRALDVRCYALGHLLAGPAVLADRQRETAASGDRLWWYGSGCYTGQDGNVYTNRFLTGFLFWASGAQGQWSWTFLRAKGSAHDDFDGSGRREAKDACIVYPSATGGAPVPTLQWEGIREGIDDYRYAWTLKQLAAKAGSAARRRAMAWQASIPIRTKAQGFSAAKAQALRRRIVGEILKLRGAK